MWWDIGMSFERQGIHGRYRVAAAFSDHGHGPWDYRDNGFRSRCHGLELFIQLTAQIQSRNYGSVAVITSELLLYALHMHSVPLALRPISICTMQMDVTQDPSWPDPQDVRLGSRPQVNSTLSKLTCCVFPRLGTSLSSAQCFTRTAIKRDIWL